MAGDPADVTQAQMGNNLRKIKQVNNIKKNQKDEVQRVYKKKYPKLLVMAEVVFLLDFYELVWFAYCRCLDLQFRNSIKSFIIIIIIIII